EHPLLFGGIVDLDPAAEESEVTDLLNEIRNPTGDGLIAFHHQTRYVARLERAQLPDNPKTVLFRQDATYLVTGGLGALGLILAQWMVDRGVRHLVLIGRKEPRPSAQTLIAQLRERAVQVVVAQVD